MNPTQARTRSREIARGERVHLRTPIERDEAEYLALRRVSWEFLAPWEAEIEGVDPLGPAMFARYLRFGPRHRRLRLGVCRNDDGVLLGSLTLGRIERGERATLGYWIGAPFARRGYMSEALQLAIAHAFARYELARLEAFVLAENEASRRLLGKLGFVLADIVPRYHVVRGEARDHERWALRAGEFTRSTSAPLAGAAQPTCERP